MNLNKMLKIVPINSLSLYEAYDPVRTKKLVKKIHKDKIFYNPIMAVRISNNNSKRLIIDGVNRYKALTKLGAKNVLIQEFDYSNDKLVNLKSNEHYLFEYSEDDFYNNLAEYKINLLTTKKNKVELNKDLKDGIEIASIQIGGKKFTLQTHKSIIETTKILNKFVDSYLGKIRIYRKSEYFDPSLMFKIKIKFREYKKDEIVFLSRKKIYLNSGITRHCIYNSIIHFKIPLKVLMENNSQKENDRYMKNMIENKLINNCVRTYFDGVTICDEWE